jgi:CRISPR-associated exonuclease Cas4
MEDDELLVPISALEHWSFCRRQCGLIHVEGLWVENRLTVEGTHLHELVDLPGLEQRPGLRKARALPLRCDRLSLVGRADMVVFFSDPAYPDGGRPYPVEYKRGAKTDFRHAELQLCAQALCLEEMLGVPVANGAIYFGRSRRRREVSFDSALRTETVAAALGIATMLRSLRTPPPEAGPKCEQCSLRSVCVPGLPNQAVVDAYIRGLAPGKT